MREPEGASGLPLHHALQIYMTLMLGLLTAMRCSYIDFLRYSCGALMVNQFGGERNVPVSPRGQEGGGVLPLNARCRAPLYAPAAAAQLSCHLPAGPARLCQKRCMSAAAPLGMNRGPPVPATPAAVPQWGASALLLLPGWRLHVGLAGPGGRFLPLLLPRRLSGAVLHAPRAALGAAGKL